MVEKTTIPLKFPFTGCLDRHYYKSENVECAGFEWHVDGTYDTRRHYEYNTRFDCMGIANVVIHCAPVDGDETSIWRCDAWGEIQFVPNSPRLLVESVPWMHSYDFRHQNTSSPVRGQFILGRFRHRNTSGPTYGGFVCDTDFIYVEGGKPFLKLEVSLNVNISAKIDLWDSENEMIQSAEDGAKVVVEGETLWVSKSILGAFSPFFKALFNSDFKEKREGLYKLEDIKLSEFKHIVSLLYGLPFPVDGGSVEYLLLLADMYQCSAITNRCRDFLMYARTSTMSAVTKLQLADRYGLLDAAKEVIEEMTVDDLKNCPHSTLVSCSSSTHLFLMNRLKDHVKR